MSGIAIDIQKLSKQYSGANQYALKDLSIHVNKGEVYGFLGPNGAGKSTTIRLLLNFIQPTEGGATISGLDIVKESVQIKKSIGYLSGEVALYPKMTGSQFFKYMSELQPLKNQSYLRELAKRFKAEIDAPLRSLSKGNRQKIGIIQAFMHEPEVFILDEPTGGLDPLMQEEFFKLIHETKQRGASVFFSSHNLSEVQKICDRVGFIRDGKLIAEQAITNLGKNVVKTFEVVFSGDASQAELHKIPGAKIMVSGKTATISIKNDLKNMFQALAKLDVISINQRETNLEEEFLHYYSEGKDK